MMASIFAMGDGLGRWIGRGSFFGRASAMRVSKAKHSLSAGIYAVDFAACPEILPSRMDNTAEPVDVFDTGA